MKNLKIVLIFIFTIISCKTEDDDFHSTSEDVIINDQNELISFSNNKYEKIEGSLQIYNCNDLSSLSTLKVISANLKIQYNENLNNLNGLENLSDVESIIIKNNAKLINLKGLEKIKKVKKIELLENGSLNSLKGLDNLESVSNSFTMWSHKSLKTFDGLNNLSKVGARFTINGSLKDLNGFDNLSEVGVLSIMFIKENINDITDDDFPKLTTIGTLEIHANKFKAINSFNQVTSLNSLKITGNDVITSINSLNSLSKMVYKIEINNNQNLQKIAGFDNLEETGEETIIKWNENLFNFCAFKNVNIFGHIEISDNKYNPTKDELTNIKTCEN